MRIRVIGIVVVCFLLLAWLASHRGAPAPRLAGGSSERAEAPPDRPQPSPQDLRTEAGPRGVEVSDSPVVAGAAETVTAESKTPLPEVPMPAEWGDLPNLGRLSMPPHGLRRLFIGDGDTVELSAEGIEVQATDEEGVLVVFGAEEGTVWLRIGEAGAVEFRVDSEAPLQTEVPEDEIPAERSVGDAADTGASIPIYLAVGEEVLLHLLGLTSVAVSAPDVVHLEEGAEPDTLLVRGLAPGLAVVQLGEDRHEVWVHDE